MERKKLDVVLQQNNYLKGGTKEACIKARDFLRHKNNPESQNQFIVSCVSEDEFVEAVKVLMAYAFQREDEMPDMWYCDSDCKRTFDVVCPGECNISKESKVLCPFFVD